MSELKPCPFCGSEVQDDPHTGEKYPRKSPMGGWIIHCECCGASLSQFRKSGKGEISWNTRPIEDALNKRIAELEEAQRWRVVADGELPEVYRDEDGKFIPFLVCEGDGGNPFIAMYNGINWWAGIFVPDITHWMPLPSLPEVQE